MLLSHKILPPMHIQWNLDSMSLNSANLQFGCFFISGCRGFCSAKNVPPFPLKIIFLRIGCGKFARSGEISLHTGSLGCCLSFYDWLKLYFHSVKSAHSMLENFRYEWKLCL